MEACGQKKGVCVSVCLSVSVSVSFRLEESIDCLCINENNPI